MRASVVVALLLVVLGAAGCASRDAAVRVGILTDCTGGFSAFRELELAGVEIPLLERGARRAAKSGPGIARATVADVDVELVHGCAESSTYSVLIEEARRLVEDEHVDVLIGPPVDSDGLVLREIARRAPHVTFLLTLSRSQESTLRKPAANVFRFQPDGAQQAAGLGSHAYRTLGWRTAAVVGDDYGMGWARAAGFIAEFCALGGKVTDRIFSPVFSDPAKLEPRIPTRVDGVALVPAVSFVDWSGLVRALRSRWADVARHVVAGPEMLIEPANRRRLARVAPGLVAGNSEPYTSRDTAWRTLRAHIARYFPGLASSAAAPSDVPLLLAYRNAMEAVVQALDRVDDDLGDGSHRFREALAGLRLETPSGTITLDENRQAVGPAYLTRLELSDDRKPRLRPMRIVPGVEQSFNGYFSGASDPPSASSPSCRRASPPAWAAAAPAQRQAGSPP